VGDTNKKNDRLAAIAQLTPSKDTTMLTQTKPRFLNLVTIQSKALDQDGVPEETITIEVPSNEPLTLHQRRQAYWEKRWTHLVVEHLMIEPVIAANEF